MEITTSQYKHCDLLKISGRVDSFTAPKLSEAASAITDSGRFKIVLDLTEVNFMSSAGLRILISTQKNCKRYNRGEVVLVGVQENVRAALDLAGFIPLFKFYDDILSAVGNF